MNVDYIENKWIPALESDSFSQTKGQLRNNVGYCCLGVVCSLMVEDGLLPAWEEEDEFFDENEEPAVAYSIPDVTQIGINFNQSLVLPTAAQKFLGLGEEGEITIDEYEYDYAPEIQSAAFSSTTSLATLNDNGFPFKEIANRLRQMVETYKEHNA